MFTAALFTIARSWKQPKCPLTDKWIEKLWYICTTEYYSAIKRNKIESFVETWMELESVIQRSKSEREKQIQYANTYIWHRRKILKKSHEEPSGKIGIKTQTY